MKYDNLRNEVFQAVREIYDSQMVIGTWGNVSARADDELMVITPSGMDYHTMTIEDMVVVDFNNNVAEGKYKPSVETPMHAGIYRQRSDIKALVHVHSPWATVFAVSGSPIPVILEETAQVIGHEIPVAPYAHCGSDELAEAVIATMGRDKKAVLLANHGLIAGGKDTREAIKACYIAEKTAMIAIHASMLGRVNQLSDRDVRILNQSFKSYGQVKKE